MNVLLMPLVPTLKAATLAHVTLVTMEMGSHVKVHSSTISIIMPFQGF